ncbi:MAG: hypothetical protein QG559_1550, partial [Campylobacterota bacterium]|nr:hypothetical protein [Campylobacterota bacterium]
MNLTQLSKYFNRCDSYLSTIKNIDKEKFDFIMSFDSDAKKSVVKYFEFVGNLINNLQKEIYENRELFRNILPKVGYKYSKTHKTLSGFERSLFSIRMDFLGVRYKLLQRYIEI